MRREWTPIWLLWGFIIGLLCGSPWALDRFLPPARAENGAGANITNTTVEANRIDQQTGYFRTAVAAADTVTATAILATTEFACVTSGTTNTALRPSLVFNARFSAASQTCKVRYVAVYKNTSGTNRIKDMTEEITLTGSTLKDENGAYMSQSEIAPAMGGNYGRLIVTTMPASGTVSLNLGSY